MYIEKKSKWLYITDLLSARESSTHRRCGVKNRIFQTQQRRDSMEIPMAMKKNGKKGRASQLDHSQFNPIQHSVPALSTGRGDARIYFIKSFIASSLSNAVMPGAKEGSCQICSIVVGLVLPQTRQPASFPFQISC